LNTIVLDAGAVIGIERRDRRVVTVLERARTNDWRIVVPAPVLAETWRGARTNPLVARLFLSVHEVSALDRDAAIRIGALLAKAVLSGGAEVVDAAVVDTALAVAPCLIVTSDPADIRRLLVAGQPKRRIEVYAV
jgi:predicted nucleic acid-binding protein